MPHRPDPTPRASSAPAQKLSDTERDELQSLLDGVPAPLEPLDVSMLDGFLCGVLVQPREVPASHWLPHVTDADGRVLPRGFDAARLHALVQRRHAELNSAISQRQWFDPWVFEMADAADGHTGKSPGEADNTADDTTDVFDSEPAAIDAVYPWVAGFATAMELFPSLMESGNRALTEPLALLYRHLDPDDLEDADDLLEEIASMEPPTELGEAVEGLVRATLLLADVGRPVSGAGASSAAKAAGARPGAARRAPPRRH